jgi:ATP synthase F1 gamma subunit
LRISQILPFELSHLDRRSRGEIKEDPSRGKFKTWSEKDWENYDVYLFEPDLAGFCNELLVKYMRTELYRVLLETLASEHAARMTAMDNATDNASDMIEALTLEYNRARQAAITKELSDIVGGAEAMK